MLLFLVQFFVLVNARPSPSCKASVGSPSWPSLSKWKALNHTLSGKLLNPSPYGAICHPERPEYDAAVCPSVAQAWFKVDTYAELPIDIAWSQWANDSCLPWTPEPCTDDGFPVYVVNATSSRDVKKGVDFARENNVRLVVKSTGHDYLGRSTAPNSLSIWTHHMTGISFSKGFKPKGCHFSIDTDAVTFAAGTLMGQLNTAGAARNLTIISGGERTVGYGGYMTGAGHGALSATYGMAADQVLELEIVTPSGDIVTANECKNQDLFWAMRGGGGSTFGIITSTTIKAFPSSPMLSLNVQIGTVPESEPFWDMSTYLLGQFPRLSNLGIAGYGSLAANASVQGTYFGGFQGIFFIPALSAENTTESLAAAFAPILNYISTTWPSQFLTITAPKTYPQFNDFFLDTSGPDYGGVDILVGSRLLDSKALSSSPESLKKALKGAMTPEGISPYLLSGKGVKNAIPRGGSNSINPAWRESLVHLVLGVGWDYHSPTIKAAQENLLTNKYVKALRDLAPNTGAYVNEADPNEPDFQHAFWGANYERLLRIKRKVDPEDVFWCTPCVGNERWKVDGNVLCRV